jgi:integrase/recombinase XerD
MKTPSVRIIKYVKDGDVWKYATVAFYLNGKIKPDPRPGTFYLDWLEDSKRRRLSVGSDPQEALNALKRKELALKGASLGVLVAPDPEGKRHLRTCVDEFLLYVKEHKSKKTYNASAKATEHFLESCKKDFIEDLTRDDLLDYKTFLKDKKRNGNRTVANKWERLINFLKYYDIVDLHEKGQGGDAPRYTEEAVDIYEQTELDPLWKACTEDELALFQLFLCSGMREQELAHLYVKNISFEKGIIQVRAKPELNWSPKAFKGRDIPLAPQLVEPLKAYIARHKSDCLLLFPNVDECRPEGHFLRRLHAIVERAGLDTAPYWLHKFRSTFATTALWNGVDLRTVQEWMGHDDLESTMRYLKPAGGKAAQDKMKKLKF